MKWAIPKKRDSGFFVVPRPKPKSVEKDPAFGDFNLPIPEREDEEDENGDALVTEQNGGPSDRR